MRRLLLFPLGPPLLTASLSLSDLSDLSLLPRQQPGTPQYDCHAACGSVIQLSRTPEYCTTPNFTTALTSCLSCALTFDIWQSYGDSVSEAAATCNVDAFPLAANTTSSIVISVSVSSLTDSMPASSASSETATGADPSATGDTAEQTASLGETQTTASETAQSATAASESADAATRPMGNEVVVGMGLLAWLFHVERVRSGDVDSLENWRNKAVT